MATFRVFPILPVRVVHRIAHKRLGSGACQYSLRVLLRARYNLLLGVRVDLDHALLRKSEQKHGGGSSQAHGEADARASQQNRGHEDLAEDVVIHAGRILEQEWRQQNKQNDVRVRALPRHDGVEDDLGEREDVVLIHSVAQLFEVVVHSQSGAHVAEEEHHHSERRVERLAAAGAVAELPQKRGDGDGAYEANQQEGPPSEAIV